MCGGCLDFKVVTALDADAFGAWEEGKFAPEEKFLEKIKAIDGVTQVCQCQVDESLPKSIRDGWGAAPDTDRLVLSRNCRWRHRLTPSCLCKGIAFRGSVGWGLAWRRMKRVRHHWPAADYSSMHGKGPGQF